MKTIKNRLRAAEFPKNRNLTSLIRTSPKVYIAALTLAFAASSNAQTIIQYSERAQPGDPINIVGDGLSGLTTIKVSQINSSGVAGSPVTLPVTAQASGALQANAPTTFTNGLWKLQVSNGSSTSNAVYVNLAEIYFVDAPQASPGATINIYGRNLEVLGTSTVGTVKLVPASGPSIYATVQKAGPYSYTVTVPSTAVPGTTYSIVVNNGYGGTLGNVTAPTQLLIQPAASDPFGLGVWWGTQFTFANNIYNIKSDARLSAHATGQGKTEDAATFAAAVAAASKAGGGVVYLPAGTYRIGSSTSLMMPSNVVIKGDGPGKTFLQFGYNWTPTNAPSSTNNVFPLRWASASLFGLYGLTIQNLNTSSVMDYTVVMSSTNSPSNRMFIANCDLQLGNGIQLQSMGATNFLFQNNTLEQTATQSAPLDFGNSMYTTVRNNTISYRNGCVGLYSSSNVVFQNNTILRDNNYMTVNCPTTEGIAIDSTRFAVVANNTGTGQGPFPAKVGCGEWINTQLSQLGDEEDYGTVTSATASTLTNSKAGWETATPFTPPSSASPYSRAVVSIVSGKGAGQWRYISFNTATTLTVAQAWQVIPDSTSCYAIGWWSADRDLIFGNTLSNSSAGIELWEGGFGCVIDSNVLQNTGQILIRATSNNNFAGFMPGYMKTCRHTPAWNNWISNNTVTNNNGNTPAKIVTYGVSCNGVSRGSLCLNTEIRSNSVNASMPNTFSANEAGSYEGYYIDSVMYPNAQKVTPPLDPFNNMASIILKNTSSNLTSPFTIKGAGLATLVTQVTTAFVP